MGNKQIAQKTRTRRKNNMEFDGGKDKNAFLSIALMIVGIIGGPFWWIRRLFKRNGEKQKRRPEK